MHLSILLIHNTICFLKSKKNIITFVGKLNKSKGYDIFGNTIIKILNKHKPNGIFNLAAETHVDRSIDNPRNFIKSNKILKTSPIKKGASSHLLLKITASKKFSIIFNASFFINFFL